MSLLAALLRRTIMVVDGILRRYNGVWEFTQDPECIFRISVSRSPVTMTLADGFELHQGDPVGAIHMWNERLGRVTTHGAGLAGAVALLRCTEKSLRLVAAYAAAEPRLCDAIAFGGETGMFPAQTLARPEDVLARFGFSYQPMPAATSPLHRFHRFFERFYSWLLMWTFNPATLRWKAFAQVGRGQAWMSRAQMMAWAARPGSLPATAGGSKERHSP